MNMYAELPVYRMFLFGAEPPLHSCAFVAMLLFQGPWEADIRRNEFWVLGVVLLPVAVFCLKVRN